MDVILKYFSDFSPQQLQQLRLLEDIYKQWNEKINVISRKDIDSIYEKHVLHSLAIAAAFDFAPGSKILDIGTGGGFPGVPLAIYFPEVQFHLVDSIGKKVKVVQSVVETLGLQNASFENIRAEQVKERKFDFVVSRAVAPLRDLWKWSKHLLRPSTSEVTRGLIALKGGDLAEEISQSGCRPKMTELFEIFPEEYFMEKFMLLVTR